MRCSWIRNSGYDIRLNIISLCHAGSAVISHLLYTHTLVWACRVTIVYPQESTYLHVLARLHKRHTVGRCEYDNLTRAKFFIVMIAKVFVGKVLKWRTECTILLAYDHRSSSMHISGCIYSILVHEQEWQRTVYLLQRISYSVYQIILLVDEGCHQLCAVDIPSAHLKEMWMPLIKYLLGYLVNVVDLADSCQGICSVMWTYYEWLWLIIGYTSYSQIALHVLHIFVELCSEWSILDIVYGSVKSLISIHCHASASCSKMWMIVYSKE